MPEIKYRLNAYLIIDYSGSPALRKAALNSPLFGPLDAFSHFAMENLGFILSTSAASVRASSIRPDRLAGIVAGQFEMTGIQLKERGQAIGTGSH